MEELREPNLIRSLEDINEGVDYLLPHEVNMLARQLEDTEIELRRLGELKNEAMHQSSETWHDNAPADAIRHEAQVFLKKRSRLSQILTNRSVLDYPTPSTPFATIGSRVTLSLNGSEPFEIYIVGVQPGEDGNGELDVCSYRAPLAKAVIGKVNGEITTADINGRIVNLQVINVDQNAQCQDSADS